MINYSFIIPHHNCPKQLNRLLDSIPQREDIEIIVVDDGKIVGMGKNNDLLKNNKVYREIAFSQLSKEELDVKD